MPSLFQMHCDRWKHGCGSDACPGNGRPIRVCHARGQIPCDLLFMGEAPGINENATGYPFVGPAGILLDKIIAKALDASTCRLAYANIVGCIPLTAEGEKLHDPPAEQVRACEDRTREVVEILDPAVIVCCGKSPHKWLEPGYKHTIKLYHVCPVCLHRSFSTPSGDSCQEGHGGEAPTDIHLFPIDHPAYILRQNVAQRGLLVQRAVVTIRDAYEEMMQCRYRRDAGPNNHKASVSSPPTSLQTRKPTRKGWKLE